MKFHKILLGFWRLIISHTWTIWKETLLTLTSSFLQGSALGVPSHFGPSVFRHVFQRVQLSLLVLFGLATVMAALRLPLPPLLLLSAWGRRLFSIVVEDILLLLKNGKDQLLLMNPAFSLISKNFLNKKNGLFNPNPDSPKSEHVTYSKFEGQGSAKEICCSHVLATDWDHLTHT